VWRCLGSDPWRRNEAATGAAHAEAPAHVENVAEGLILAAERGVPGEAYFVTDGQPVVFREFVSELLNTQGIERPQRTMPAWLGQIMTTGGETAWRLLPLPGRPPLARFTYWVLTQECTIDDSKARRVLGYAPIVLRQEGLAELRDPAVR
jgi:nucleoside-diphosphate-sugar epimerase